MVGIAIIVPIVSPNGDGLREQRELGMALKRAELERLEAEDAGTLPASESE